MRTSEASETVSTTHSGSSVQDVLPGGPLQSVALVAGLLLLAFGCRGGDRATGPETTEATSLEVGPASVALMPGDTAQLEATPVDGNGNPVSGYEVSWSSGDTAVATVDGDGTVTAVASGSTEITATAEKTNKGKGSDNGQGKKKGLKKQSDVTVGDTTTSSGLISDLEPVAYEKDTLETGDSVYVDRAYSIDGVPSEYRGWRYVRTANDDKDATSDSAVTFTLTDTARVALAYDKRATTLPDWLRDWTATGDTLRTTDVDHLIYTRVYAPGDVVLGGNQSGGAEGAYSMYVLSATRSGAAPDSDTTSSGTDTTSASVDSVDVSPDSATIRVGDSTQFSAAVYDSAGNQLSRSVSWASSDTAVATVDGDGRATGRDAGSAYITATADGVSDSARLAVDTTSPGTGALRVVTATTGDSLDSDGYTVTVDGGSGQSVGINDTTAYAELTAEDHTVELFGVASNCSVSGSNPRSVSVAENDTTPTSFEVSCESSSASSSAPVFSDDWESGDASHAENGWSWEYAGGGGCNAITQDNPHTGSYSAQVEFESGDQENCLLQLNVDSEANSVGHDSDGNILPNGREIWVEYYLYVPTNYHHPNVTNMNNKFWQIWSGDRSGTLGWKHIHELLAADNLRPNMESGESRSKMFFDTESVNVEKINWGGEPDSDDQAATIDQNDLGTWVQIRRYLRLSTPLDGDVQTDGVYRHWKNGVLRIEKTGLQTSEPIGDDNSVDAIRWFGAQNSGYNELTAFYVDDIKVYYEDPGW